MNSHSTGMHSNSLNNIALQATIHCLTGCAIGEVLGMVLGLSFGLSTGATVAMACKRGGQIAY